MSRSYIWMTNCSNLGRSFYQQHENSLHISLISLSLSLFRSISLGLSVSLTFSLRLPLSLSPSLSLSFSFSLYLFQHITLPLSTHLRETLLFLSSSLSPSVSPSFSLSLSLFVYPFQHLTLAEAIINTHPSRNFLWNLPETFPKPFLTRASSQHHARWLSETMYPSQAWSSTRTACKTRSGTPKTANILYRRVSTCISTKICVISAPHAHHCIISHMKRTSLLPMTTSTVSSGNCSPYVLMRHSFAESEGVKGMAMMRILNSSTTAKTTSSSANSLSANRVTQRL